MLGENNQTMLEENNNAGFFISKNYKTAIRLDTIKCIKFVNLSKNEYTLVIDDNIMGEIEDKYSTEEFLSKLFDFINTNVTTDFDTVASIIKSRYERKRK